MELTRKSYYQIHGEVPISGKELPGDGMFVVLDMDGPYNIKQHPRCDCKECKFQRVMQKELWEIKQLEDALKRKKKEVEESTKYQILKLENR